MKRPEPSEHHQYYGRYISKVPDGDIIRILEDGVERTLALLARIPAERADHRYAPDKWSIKEVVGHLIDTFAYRALCFARKDPAPLPSFEQEQYAQFSNASSRSLTDLAEELGLVRKSHVALFKSFDDESSVRRGVASEREFSVRAFPYIIAGHEIHHRQILKERYLPGVLDGG
jgi:hypothetical protein